MFLNFENRNLVLTIQQLDALILIRFNTGYLGFDLTKLFSYKKEARRIVLNEKAWC